MTNHPLSNSAFDDGAFPRRRSEPWRVLVSFAAQRERSSRNAASVTPADDSSTGEMKREMNRLAPLVEPQDMLLCGATDARATMHHVEAGGLSGAVIYAGPRREELDLLAMIRAVDETLPCWLVTARPTRQVLEAALALRVASVFAAPLDPDIFVTALRRTLSGPPSKN
ncbi:MAG: hypothetical protein ACPGXK_05220 [Phycisphaerae bacterium]